MNSIVCFRNARSALRSKPREAPLLGLRGILHSTELWRGRSQHPAYHGFSRRQAVAESTQVFANSRTVQVQFEDGHSSQFDYTWLRVNDPAFSSESGQRTVFPGDIDPHLEPKEVSTTNGPSNGVTITWSDGHVSTLKSDWLRAHDNSPVALHERSHSTWPNALCSWEGIPKVDGASFMTSESALYDALMKINRTGICMLENVGTKKGSVLEFSQRIAPVSHRMLYGDSFDVVRQEHPRNIAYSSAELRLHMDLVYYESPPGLQLLHCIEFSKGIEGGENTFMDAFQAASHFREIHPEHFEVLTRVPATFQKVRQTASRDEGQESDGRNASALSAAFVVYQRPHIQVDSNGDIMAVFWAPMFEGALMCPPQDVAPYYEAHAAFQEMIEEGTFARDYTVQRRLKPGQCVIFNNRRLLHGRKGYSGEDAAAGVHRGLQGCYINMDDALSRLRTLHCAQPPSDDPIENQLARQGNGCLALVDN